MPTFLYFAYGSNMFARRLAARTPSAVRITTAFVEGRRLAFDKVSTDGSGKCDIEGTGNPADRVYGVVFRIATAEEHVLDEAEGVGHGYRKDEIMVVTSKGTLAAEAYFATVKDPRRRPYDWYKAFVVQGAAEKRASGRLHRNNQSCSLANRPQYFPSPEERGFVAGYFSVSKPARLAYVSKASRLTLPAATPQEQAGTACLPAYQASFRPGSFILRIKFGPRVDPHVKAFEPLFLLMPEIGTKEHSSKAEYRLKIRLGGHLSQFVDLRTPATPGADYLFHVSNSHVRIDPKFVTDNLERVLAARFETDVEEGNERIVAREAVIDPGGGDLAHFHGHGLRIFSSSLERASNRLTQILDAYRIAEVPEKACFEIIKLGVAGTYCSRTVDLRERRTQTEDELRLHYGPDFLPWKESILGVMAKKCAGIHLLRGEPGTGKTSFIRYLVDVLS